MTYNYQRPQQDEDLLKDHDIGLYARGYGEIELSQPTWCHHRLKQVYDRTHGHLAAIQSAVQQSISIDLRHVKEDRQLKIRTSNIREKRLALLAVIKQELQDSDDSVAGCERRVLDQTEPARQGKNPNDLMVEMRLQECRTLLRNVETPEERAAIINKALANDNVDFLSAAISSPDQLLSKDRLLEIRRTRAYEKVPSLGRPCKTRNSCEM